MSQPSKSCPKCESARWMTNLLMHPPGETQVCVHPSTGWGLAAGLTQLQAAMCADCGYTELYATNPLGVWKEWSKQNR